MNPTEELVKELVELPRGEYVEVLKKVDEKRRLAAHQPEPAPGMDKEAFARWIGRGHYSIDAGITRVYYLPESAPENEVRLVEVNELASLPDDAAIVPVDFMPDIEGIDFTLVVADVTPAQWEALVKGRRDLPRGWNLDGYLQVAPNEQ